jgi:hypothetical protein
MKRYLFLLLWYIMLSSLCSGQTLNVGNIYKIATSLAPNITTDLTNVTFTIGDLTNINIVAEGADPLIYRWYTNTTTPALLSSTSNRIAWTYIDTTNAASYWVTVSNAYGTDISVTNTVTVSAGGTWAPTDEASLVVWQKADAGVTNDSQVLASDGESVAGWRDSGPRGLYATATAYPIYKTGIQNGKPVVRFEGADMMSDDAICDYIGGDDIPMIFAAAFKNNEAGVGAGTLFACVNTGGAGKYIQCYYNNVATAGYSRWDGTTEKNVSFTPDPGLWMTYIAIFTGSVGTLYTNGVVAGTANTDLDVLAISGATLFNLGCNDGPSYFDGDLGEWMIFTNSSVSVTSIQTYLKGRWATP